MSVPRSILVPAFVVVCLGIVYGSLFPFHFHFDLHPAAWGQFLASWRKTNGVGDILGNLALFFPFGYIACLICARSGYRAAVVAILVFLGLGLSLGMQIAQLFTPGRDPSIFDLYMNLGGVALGWFGGRILPLGTGSTFLGGDTAQHVSVLIAATWVVSQLLPLVPSVDLQSFKDALKPLFIYPHFQWQSFLLVLAAWSIVFHLLEQRVGLPLKLHSLIVAAGLLLVAKVLIVANYLTVNATLGLLFAVVLWPIVGRRLAGTTLALFLLVTFFLDALAPFALRTGTQNFGWLPFEGYLQGSMLINALALTRKLFIFSSVALLLIVASEAPGKLSLAIAVALIAIEILQRWIGYGTPALTDPLLFLAVVWFVHRRVATA